MLRALLLLLAAASPASAAFDGMRYSLDPATRVLTASGEGCRLEIKEVSKFEVNGLYALSGNTFPYSVFYLQSELDAEGRPMTSLYGLLGVTQLRGTKEPCRALTVRVAAGVVDFKPLPKGSADWSFSKLYQVDFLPSARVPPERLDAAIEAGTDALSRLLDSEAR